MSPQRLVLGDFGVQSSHPADLRDAAVDHLDRGRVREHLHGVVEELRVVPSAASATEPSAGSLFYERGKNMFAEIRVERSEIGQSFEEYNDE